MFNINLLKRRISISYYRYFICMCFLISGIFIASYTYNAEFTLPRQGQLFTISAAIKIFLIVFWFKYLCKGLIRFITAPIVLIYSGVCLGTFLMYVLYNLPLYKFLLTVFPCSFKTVGLVLIYSSCFEFDKMYISAKTVYVGVILGVLGEVMLWLFV